MIDLSYTNKDGATADNTKFIVAEAPKEPEKPNEEVAVVDEPTVETKKPRKKKTETEE